MSAPTREVFRCALGALPEGAAKGFEWDGGGFGRNGFVVRRGGAVHAYLNQCPHTGGRLDWKPDAFLTKDRSLIMCSTHGANFRIDDGFCTAGPCMGMSLRPLAAALDGDDVVVRAPTPPG
jgi:nitrite reductase/ring-hydroxylating ferredoxin subunit